MLPIAVLIFEQTNENNLTSMPMSFKPLLPRISRNSLLRHGSLGLPLRLLTKSLRRSIQPYKHPLNKLPILLSFASAAIMPKQSPENLTVPHNLSSHDWNYSRPKSQTRFILLLKLRVCTPCLQRE